MSVLNSMRQACLLQAIPRTCSAANGHNHCHNAHLAIQCVNAAPVTDQQRMYIVDLMPYVYKGVHLATGSTLAAQVQPPQQQQQQQQQQRTQSIQFGWAENNRASARVVAHILDLMSRKQDTPTHMAVVVDVPGPTFRHLMYPQYKGKRPERPEALQYELSCILSILDAAGIPILAVPGVEADDVAGTLAKRAAAAGLEVVLVSTDKDCYQLLQPNVSILSQPSDTLAGVYTQTDFVTEYGLSDPKHWIDVKALAGDVSDNIPGVRGVGLKTALQLVQQYGSVEHVLQCCAARGLPQQVELTVKLNKRQAEMLSSSDGAVAAKFSKQLVTIVTDLKHPPVRQPLDSFKLKVPQDGGKSTVEQAEALNFTWIAARWRQLFKDMSLQEFLADGRPLDLC